jgi:diguanylate cyclase (GGDEF)-like protein
VAETLAREARKTDVVARWGGEEFVAILPVGLDGAVIFCERARVAVAEIGNVTVSAGIAEVAADEPVSDAIERADRRLYEAKRGGRDRVVG